MSDGENFDGPVRIVPRYDPAEDSTRSYDAAIAAKKARGDMHDWEGREPVRIKVTTPGGVAKFELVVDGMLMREVTRVEIIEAIRQFASSLRF